MFAILVPFSSSTGRSEEANKALSAAVQLHDTLVKAWALWGDYLEALFTRDPTHVNLGVFAITCYLHASRHQNESKSRKYLAKVSELESGENVYYWRLIAVRVKYQALILGYIYQIFMEI